MLDLEAGESSFYSFTEQLRGFTGAIISVSLPASYGAGEVVGRCAVSVRFLRASLRGGWRLGMVGRTRRL